MFGKNQTRWYIYTWVPFSTHVWILTHMFGKTHTCVTKTTQLYDRKCFAFSTHVWEKPPTCLFPPEPSVWWQSADGGSPNWANYMERICSWFCSWFCYVCIKKSEGLDEFDDDLWQVKSVLTKTTETKMKTVGLPLPWGRACYHRISQDPTTTTWEVLLQISQISQNITATGWKVLLKIL